MNVKPLVLLSGGLDSAVCLAMYRQYQPECIAFDYGQAHKLELTFAARIADRAGAPLTVVTMPPMGQYGVVFHGRNAALATSAACFAMGRGLNTVVIGCNASDWGRFPDCRPQFWSRMREALMDAYEIRIATPLLYMTKREVVEKARELGVDLDATWSCYEPQTSDDAPPRPCGACLACKVRSEAIA